jgi:acyl carrier protein
MTSDEIKARVTLVFRDVLDCPDLELTRQTTGGDIEEWDSLANISLIVAIEKEFNVNFQLEEITSLKNVGDMLDLIQSHLS